MSAIEKPQTIGEVVEKLASVVFVQAVETPALAVTCPVVCRGLKDRKEPTKRKACVIIDNMVKLVPDPREVLPFLEKLLPLLKKRQMKFQTLKREVWLNALSTRSSEHK